MSVTFLPGALQLFKTQHQGMKNHSSVKLSPIIHLVDMWANITVIYLHISQSLLIHILFTWSVPQTALKCSSNSHRTLSCTYSLFSFQWPLKFNKEVSFFTKHHHSKYFSTTVHRSHIDRVDVLIDFFVIFHFFFLFFFLDKTGKGDSFSTIIGKQSRCTLFNIINIKL